MPPALPGGLPSRPPLFRDLFAGLERDILTNAFVTVLFGLGPLAIMVEISRGGGLSESDLVSWVFGGYGITGLMSIALAIRYREPLPIAWTIAGAVLVGPALERYSFPEVIGAYFATGLLVLVLGLTGWIRRVMDAVPMPIVFGMVAGVFLQFALNMVDAFGADFWLSLAMVGAYVAVMAAGPVARIVPPLFAALAVGILITLFTDGIAPGRDIPLTLASPNLYLPEFSLRAMVDLVLPMTITVIGIHNAQGFVFARAKGIRLPENLVTAACGLSTFALALFGSVPTCFGGPSIAIMTSAGRREHWYVGVVVFGLLFLVIAALAPAAIALALGLPGPLIAVVAGLALFGVLRDSMTTAFAGDFRTGALVAFVVTLSGVHPFGIGAAFWALVIGYGISAAVERDAFRSRRKAASVSPPAPPAE